MRQHTMTQAAIATSNAITLTIIDATRQPSSLSLPDAALPLPA